MCTSSPVEIHRPSANNLGVRFFYVNTATHFAFLFVEGLQSLCFPTTWRCEFNGVTNGTKLGKMYNRINL